MFFYDETFSKVDRQVSVSKHATVYDDLLFLLKVPSKNSKDTSQRSFYDHVEIRQCTIDAGKKDGGAAGMPILCEGVLYHAVPGSHSTSKYKTFKDLGTGIDGRGVNALHIYTGEYGKILLARITGQEKRVFESMGDALPAYDFVFCGLESNTTIHVHFTLNERDNVVGAWSSGCTALRDADLNSAKYLNFLTACANAGNSQKIPYLVVSSQYLKPLRPMGRPLPQNWFLDLLQGGPLDSKSLTESGYRIIKGGKVTAKGYTPSFATKAFFDSGILLAEQLKTLADGIRANKDQKSLKNTLSDKYQKIAQIKALFSKKKLDTMDAAKAERWSKNLNDSLKRLTFYLS